MVVSSNSLWPLSPAKASFLCYISNFKNSVLRLLVLSISRWNNLLCRNRVHCGIYFLFNLTAFSSELEQVLKDGNWLETLSKWSKLENDLRESFLDCSRSSSWRNGTAKTSFTYLLLDPRISDNLPARFEQMEIIDVWRTFTKAIFYIGKGTRARPYEHLHEAFLIWGETKASKNRRCTLKVIVS